MRWMAWRRVDVVAALLGDVLEVQGDPATVVDFGCGTGVLLAEAASRAHRVVGVDLVLDSAEILLEEQGLGDIELLQPDQFAKTVESGSVDVIIAAEVLEHIDPLQPTLSLFGDKLKAGGRLIVSIPTEGALYRLGRRLAGFHGHYHHRGATPIHDDILRAGFRQIRIKRIPAPGPFCIYWVIEYARPADNTSYLQGRHSS